MNDEKWTPSLSPNQEWKLHNGEGKVPEWFIRWSDRVYEAAKEEERKSIEEEVEKMNPGRSEQMSFKIGFWEAKKKILSIINKHQ